MRKKAKVSVFLLIMMLVCSTLSFGALADGLFSGGTGTAGDPYLISTSDDLLTLSAKTNAEATNAEFGAACYKLTADIDMKGVGGFKGLNCMDPAWNYAYFVGTFDGNGHVIKNLTIDASGVQRARGFISMAGAGAVIKNLGIEDMTINGGAPDGGIVGMAGSAGVTIENCYLRGASFSLAGSWQGKAGICGAFSSNGCSATIKNCYVVDADLPVCGHNIGAQDQYKVYGNLENCYTVASTIATKAFADGFGETNCYTNAETNEAMTVAALGSAYKANTGKVYNKKLPILAWETISEPQNLMFSGGSGTVEDPYLLSTSSDLLDLSAKTNAAATNAEFGAACYKLTADIDMNGASGFKGLNCMDTAWNYAYFTGTIDGNNHVIRNLTIAASGVSRARGFISMAGAGAVVKNLGIENITISGGAPVGGIVGMAGGAGVTVENCYVRGASFSPASAWQGSAGICGALSSNGSSATIKNCYVTDASLPICGYNTAATDQYKVYANLENCYTTGPEKNNYSKGYADGFGATNCYANATTATVTAADLGEAYKLNTGKNYNFKLPVLAWETITDAGEFSGGEGTVEEPFLLSSSTDLIKLSQKTNAAATNAEYGAYHYKLIADINMSGVTGFKGLNCMDTAWNYAYFTGSIDGDGHVIKNLTIDASGVSRARGFISMAGAGAVIKNLGIENMTINGGAPDGGIVGMAGSAGVTIENCYLRGATFSLASAWQGKAGICGAFSSNSCSATIKNCYVSGADLTVCGFNTAAEDQNRVFANLENCYTTGGAVANTFANGFGATNCYAGATATTISAGQLGDGYMDHSDASYNEAMPILKWEYIRKYGDITYADLSVAVSGNGAVTYNGQTVNDGQTLSLPTGSSCTLTLAPEAGYIADQVLFNGQPLAISQSKVSFKMEQNSTLSVSFKEVTSANACFYVSPDGSDSNDGSLEHPFATLDYAKTAVASYKQRGDLPAGAIYVYLRGGEYPVSSALTFNADDSGTADHPIVYSAYQDETVTFVGGVKVPYSAMQKVTDTEILNKLIDPAARGKLMQVDLAALGINDIPAYTSFFGGPQKRIKAFMNGSRMEVARYPNDVAGHEYLTLTSVSGTTAGPFTVGYNDPADRTKLWSQDSVKELMIKGGIAYGWAIVNQRVTSIDTNAKTWTSADGTPYLPIVANGQFFFYNILDELDAPGEYYIDRATKMMYFYPSVKDLESAELYLSQCNTNMIKVDGASYLTFQNLGFEYSNETPLSVNGNNLTFDGLTVAHTSANGVELRGNNITFSDSYLHDFSGHGLSLSGSGNRPALTDGQVTIANNRIHSASRDAMSNGYPININESVGTIVENNELYNVGASAIFLTASNNVKIRNNEIYRSVLAASDMGAIYWGRDLSSLGNEITGNYFHNNGNPFGQYGQQSIFVDDGGSCPYVAGNVFYNAGSLGYKTHAGQCSILENNIFVDTNPLWFQQWNASGPQTVWWLYHMDKAADKYGGVWGAKTMNMLNDTWKNFYQGTQWASVYDVFSMDIYNMVKPYDRSSDKKTLNNIAKKYAPESNNTFRSNIVLGYPINETGGIFSNNFTADTAAFKNYFADFDAQNFALTAEGLTAVRRIAPDFEAISMDNMGLTSAIGGTEPTASSALLSQDATTLSCDYTFADADGDREGATQFRWYVSDTEDGTFTPLTDRLDSEFAWADLADSYIYCEVTPYDCNGLCGDTIRTATIKVGEDVTNQYAQALQNAINAGNTLKSDITAADYAAALLDALDSALQQGGSASTSSIPEMSAAIEAINNAIDRINAHTEALDALADAVERGQQTQQDISAAPADYSAALTDALDSALQTAATLDRKDNTAVINATTGIQNAIDPIGLHNAFLADFDDQVRLAQEKLDAAQEEYRFDYPEKVMNGMINALNAADQADRSDEAALAGIIEQINAASAALDEFVKNLKLFNDGTFEYMIDEGAQKATLLDCIYSPVPTPELEIPASIAMYSSYSNYGTPAVTAMYSMYSINDLLLDTTGWTTSIGDAPRFENGSIILSSASRAAIVYTAKQYDNALFRFKMKAEVIDPSLANAKNAWAGVYFRQDVTNNFGWTGTCAMLDFKQDLIQYQQYPGLGIIQDMVRDDKQIVMGHEYDVTAGVYDIKDSGKVRLVLKMDDDVVYDQVLESNALLGVKGFLSFNSGANTKLTLSPSVSQKELDEKAAAEKQAAIAAQAAYSAYSSYSCPVTAIGNYAFINCPELISVTMSDNIEKIGEGAFAYCTGLTEFVVPDKVTKIDDYTFMGCENIESLMLPAGLTEIGESAFEDCTNLGLVFFMGTRLQWEQIAIAEGNDILKTLDDEECVICLEEGNRRFGDVNGDEKVDAADAVLILRHDSAQELITDTETLDYADINRDGKVNVADAILVLQIDAGFDSIYDGHNLTISYLGGSITEGSGASPQKQNRWTTLLTGQYFNNFNYFSGGASEANAGIGGTPSDLGLFRLKQDVSSKNPDVVFVEFAVNDSKTVVSGADGKLQVQQRMEGILRQLAKLPKVPYVIFVYTATNSDGNFDRALQAAQAHKEVADAYGIGSINLCEYVAGGTDLQGNPIVWDKNAQGTWTGDGSHPNNLGYAKYAEFINKELTEHPERYYKKMTVPEEPVFGYEYVTPGLIAATNTSYASYDKNWSAGGSDYPFRGKTDKVMYTTAAKATATFRFTGRSIGLYCLRGRLGNTASYEIRNDAGTFTRTGTVSNYYDSGNMTCSTMLINGLPYDQYTLTLTTNNPSPAERNLFAIGYYMVDGGNPAK